MFFYQCGACGKDRRKRQEQTSHNRTAFVSNEACACGNQSTKNESNGIIVPPGLPESRVIDFDLHAYFSHTYHSPAATQNQREMDPMVAQSALSL